jgi:hypothetical protein
MGFGLPSRRDDARSGRFASLFPATQSASQAFDFGSLRIRKLCDLHGFESTAEMAFDFAEWKSNEILIDFHVHEFLQ